MFRRGEVARIARSPVALYALFVILDSGVNTILIQRTIERQELRSGAARGGKDFDENAAADAIEPYLEKSRVSFSLGTPVVFVRGGSRPRSIYFTPSLSEKSGAVC